MSKPSDGVVTPEFLLERFVHQTLQGEQRSTGALLERALAARVPAEALLLEILWPTVECVQQLRQDGTVGVRTYNAAVRTLRSMLDMLAGWLPRESGDPQGGRSLMIVTAPGESEELGAHVVATLAESHGWRVHFGGAGLPVEEITFALGQLSADVVVIQATFAEAAARVRKLIERLQRVRIWPRAQVAVVGGVVAESSGKATLGADVMARDPVELLELLALCPEYRATPLGQSRKTARGAGKALELPVSAALESLSISTEVMRKVMAQHFRRLTPHAN